MFANESKIVSFSDEQLILVDQNDNVLGYDTKEKIHLDSGQLHRAFSIFIFSTSNKILLQQRSRQKELWPNYWSNSVCSHPRRGETYKSAAKRRLLDELGIEAHLKSVFKFLYTAEYKSIGSENELCTVFIGMVDENVDLNINQNEIEAVKWVSEIELNTLVNTQPDTFTPWLLLEWDILRRLNIAEQLPLNMMPLNMAQ